MSIVIHFTAGTSSLLSSTTAVPSAPACVIDAETSNLDMGPALENDSSLSIMSPDDSSMVDVSTSDSYSGKDKGHASVSYHGSLGTCFGLPYQDHNYGAPPPPTPPSRSPQLSPVPVVSTDIETETVSSEAIASLHSEEVTETSITRCVCGFDHDDEYMICCDRCLVWQHVDCMGLDRNKIPETYLCDKCEPRKIDRQKAKLLQAKKKVALTGRFLYGDTSEESEDDRRDKNQNMDSVPKTRSKSSKRRIEDDIKSEHPARKGKSKHGKERMEIKRSKFRRKAKSKSENIYVGDEAAQDTWKCSDSCKGKDESSESSSETHQQMQNLGATLRSQSDEAKASKQLQDQLCKLIEFSGNQKKLFAATDLSKDKIIIEYKGQFLSATQFHQKNPVFSQKQFPFVLFYKLRSHEELCVDGAENGNEARFVRRSCLPNAEIRHLVSNGALHLYISSIKPIMKDEEITIPFDVNFKDCLHEIECACNTDNCFINKQKKRSESGERRRRGRKQLYSTDDDSNHSLVDSHVTSPTKSIKTSPIKASSPVKAAISATSTPVGETSDTNVASDEHFSEEHVKEQRKKMTREERKLDAIMRAFDQMEKAAKRRQQALDRQAHQKGLQPKSEELTDKQDTASTSLKEEDKQNVTENSSVDDEKPVSSNQQPKHKKGKRRRGSGNPVRRRTRTSSGGSDVFTADDNATTGDNTTHSTTPSTPSIEASETISPEAEMTSLASSPPSSQGGTSVLPKTKRFLHNEWLQEKECVAPVSSPLTIQTDMNYNLTTPPPKIYVRCTKSNPLGPGISAAHLRRNSIIGHGKLSSSQGSAKKRWLRQAMYEPLDGDVCGGISMEIINGEVASPSHAECLSPTSDNGIHGIVTVDDVITPLKKRRLMRKSVESSSSDWIGVSSELSPDNSSCDSTADNSAESIITTNIGVEILKNNNIIQKTGENITCGGNGTIIGQHLLKTLREKWIKHDMKSKHSDIVAIENNTSNHSNEISKPLVQDPVSENSVESKALNSSECNEQAVDNDASVKIAELLSNVNSESVIVGESATNGVEETATNGVEEIATNGIEEHKINSSAEISDDTNTSSLNNEVSSCSASENAMLLSPSMQDISSLSSSNETSTEAVKDADVPLAESTDEQTTTSSLKNIDGETLNDVFNDMDNSECKENTTVEKKDNLKLKSAINELSDKFNTNNESSSETNSSEIKIKFESNGGRDVQPLNVSITKELSSPEKNSENASNNLPSPVTPKRKVSLLEYRQRRRDNPSPVKAVEKKKTNNCVLNAKSSLEDLTDTDIKLAALPLFKSFANKPDANSIRERRSFRKDYFDRKRMSAFLSSSTSMFMKPRENLEERLKRELGIGNDNESHNNNYNNDLKLQPSEKEFKRSTLLEMTSLGSKLPPSPPPPPPPPPRSTLDKTKSSKLNCSPTHYTSVQLPSSSQVTSHLYISTTSSTTTSVIPNVNNTVPPGTPPTNNYSAKSPQLSYPVMNNQSFSAQQQVSLTQPLYHSTPQMYK